MNKKLLTNLLVFFPLIIYAQNISQDSVDIYVLKGDWHKALRLIDIQLNTANINKVERSELLSLSGYINLKLGQYQKVEYYYETAINLLGEELNNSQGVNYRSTAVDRDLVLLRLATFYAEFNLNELALKYGRESCINMSAWTGDDSPYSLYSLVILAELFQQKGSLKHAKNLYSKALKIIDDDKRIVFKENERLNYLTKLKTLNNIALIYNDLKVKEKAEEYIKLALLYIKKNNFSISECARTQYVLGKILISSGEYQKAIISLEKSLDIFREFKENKSFYFQTVALDLVLLYDKLSIYNKLESLISEVNQIHQAKLFKVFDFGSDFEKEFYLTGEDSYYSTVYSIALKNKFKINSIQETSCNTSLLVNGIILNAGQRKIQSNETNIDVKNTYKKLQNAKARLATQYMSPELQKKALSLLTYKRPGDEKNLFGAPYFRGLTELEFNVEQLEKEIIRKSVNFDSASQSLSVNWRSIKQRLSAKEAAIQFIRFPYFNSDSILYAAFVMRKEYNHPKMIALFEEKQLNEILNKSVNIDQYINKLYASKYPNNLYKLVWHPLDSLLNGVDTIWYVTSGRLNQISFAALPVGLKDSLLCNKYSLHQLVNIRYLLHESVRTEPSFANISATLFGAIEYSEDSISLARKASTIDISKWEQNTSLKYYDKWFKLDTWSQIDSIKHHLSRLMGSTLKVYLDTAATEENFKSLTNKSQRIIHLATHGFYYSPPEKKIKLDSLTNNTLSEYLSFSENPLIRSGIILEGANYAWTGGKLKDNVEDGILTAYEVSGMDLSNTELVVLSACETGLGDINNREGVYGLQRAFKQAGVRYLLITLWEVPEKETNEFINKFYHNLVRFQSTRLAFKNAQQYMIAKYKNNPSPFNWAGFVLLE